MVLDLKTCDILNKVFLVLNIYIRQSFSYLKEFKFQVGAGRN